MTSKRLGRQTIALANPPNVLSCANIGGKIESQGPLASYFDTLCQDSFFGQKSWEKAESSMQKTVLQSAMRKAHLKPQNMDYIFAGDLLNQCIGSSFAMRNEPMPFMGVYSACASMGEGLALAAMMVDGGYATHTAAMASSHFCSAERQYRMPLPYGNQRTPTAQWTATAAGCCILGGEGSGPYITRITTGTVVDWGIKDANNMGAAMAPAAYATLKAHFAATETTPADYDLIVTGDLGELGHAIVQDLFCKIHVDMTRNYKDCGMLIYDRQAQDMHAGGSGAGCSAGVFCGYLLQEMAKGTFRHVLFAPTGALLSTTSSLQGESIPGVCHAIELSCSKV